MLSKDFQNLRSLVMGSPGGEGGAQSGASQAGDRGVQSRGSVRLCHGLGLGPAPLSSLVVMPKKAKKRDGLKIQPQRLVASWEAWVHSVTGELLTSGSLQALGSQAPTKFGVEPKGLQGISHARSQREVPSPGPSGTREASWGSLPVSLSVLYPLGPHQHNQFLGVLGRGGVRWPRLTSLPKPTGDWLMLLQGREAWGHQCDGPQSWQGKGVSPGCLGVRTAWLWDSSLLLGTGQLAWLPAGALVVSRPQSLLSCESVVITQTLQGSPP